VTRFSEKTDSDVTSDSARMIARLPATAIAPTISGSIAATSPRNATSESSSRIENAMSSTRGSWAEIASSSWLNVNWLPPTVTPGAPWSACSTRCAASVAALSDAPAEK
jgi:hypothetical protein